MKAKNNRPEIPVGQHILLCYIFLITLRLQRHLRR